MSAVVAYNSKILTMSGRWLTYSTGGGYRPILTRSTIRFEFINNGEPDTSFDPVTVFGDNSWQPVYYMDGTVAPGVWDWVQPSQSSPNQYFSNQAHQLTPSVLGNVKARIVDTDISYMGSCEAAFFGASSLVACTWNKSGQAQAGQFYNLNDMLRESGVHYVCLNTAGQTALERMCYGCVDLEQADIVVTDDVVSLDSLFRDCTSLVGFTITGDLSNVASIQTMCEGCTRLQKIPGIQVAPNTCGHAFDGCVNVQYGILRMYNTLVTSATSYSGTFQNCGVNTAAGSAELAQVPAAWK